MEETLFDVADPRIEEQVGKKASLALQRALTGAGAWMTTNVRDDRKCDHALLPAEIPANIRDKVARILQDRGGKENISVEVVDPKAPWHQQLEQHVARLMQQMRSQPEHFRKLLLMAASETAVNASSSVDSRKAYRRIRRAVMALGEEIFYLVQAFVRRSEVNGVLPQDAQVVRLASLYKLELRRHVTISAVIECINQADRAHVEHSSTLRGINSAGLGVKRQQSKHLQLRRQVKSAGVTSSGPGDVDPAIPTRAASAPADAPGLTSQVQQNSDSGAASDKVKSVHAFKLQALERLLAKTWSHKNMESEDPTTFTPASRSKTTRSLPVRSEIPTKLPDETLVQIQERVTAFLYHKSRENYPLWSEPPLSREETARHLRALVATLLTTPLMQGLTIDQLLEVARATRWQTIALGNNLCVQNTEIDTLIIVMDGSLAGSTDTESSLGSHNPPPGSKAVIAALICLGEIGMVRSAERWPRTLTVQSPDGVKALILPKLTFDALLHRFFSGGKAITTALAAATNGLQPRRPSSSPAVIARQFARTFRNSLSARRPSTAAPTAAMDANIARWHEVRDEKLRGYRAGLEAEERAAALEALQRAMEELSSELPEGDGVEYLLGLGSALSPRKEPWSRHESYPSYDRTVYPPDCPETDFDESADQPRSNNSPLDSTQAAPPTGSSSAEQLREYYRSLNARRSVMKARLAFSAPSDQMVQPSPERKNSIVVATAAPATPANVVSETNWWVNEDEEPNNSCLPANDDNKTPHERTIPSVPGANSPYQGCPQDASLSLQCTNFSVAASPSKEGVHPSPPLKSPLKSSVPSLSQNPQQKGGSCGCEEDNESTCLTGTGNRVIAVLETIKPETTGPETTEPDEEEASPGTPSQNQVEDTTITRARKSALNVMLSRQSTATMARHSKLLDKETAQQVLIQKHFADTTALGSPGSRPQSGRPQSGRHPISEQPNESHAPLPLRADLQLRMDSVLNRLLLPPKAKLDVVLKYTHVDHYDQFSIAVQLWERAQGAVAKRERVMKLLWNFEMLASDPRRHFRSISTHRLREEKERDALFYKLNQASNACLEVMDELWKSCGDTVSLGYRSYRDKMKKDYTELLYEVEQERLRIIYDGVHPHVAPAIDENDENGPEQGEGETLSARPLSGRTLIEVQLPSIAPHRPLNKKDGKSSEITVAAGGHDNQELEERNGSPKFVVAGTNAEAASTHFSLTTPRESIFIPVSSLEIKQESELEQQLRRASRVTVQVQQQRRAEFEALNKQLEQQKEPESAQSIRPPEKVYVAPAKDAKRSAAREKQQEERASLREMFQQFMNRSNF